MIAGGVEEDAVLVPGAALHDRRFLLLEENLQLSVHESQGVFRNERSVLHRARPDHVADLQNLNFIFSLFSYFFPAYWKFRKEQLFPECFFPIE